VIRFYFQPPPNPAKVALFLEETGFQAVNARPAVAKARAVGNDHVFKKESDEETRRAMFPSNYPLAAA